VGEQPANVYWKRRIAVVAAIVVFALLLWWLISAMTGGSGTPATPPANTTSPDPTVTSSTDAASMADPSRPCTADDITVVTTSPTTFTGNKLPTFKVTVTSTGTSACVVDPAKDAKTVVISGKETWFDSSTCKDFVVFDAEKFVIEPKGSKELTSGWNRGRGEKACSTEAQPAHKGSYWVTATVQGVPADKVQFALG